MQTHDDTSHVLTPAQTEILEKLHAKAKAMTAEGLSSITAGVPGESILTEYQYEGMFVRSLPADEHGVLRVSVGGFWDIGGTRYCVYRGDPDKCLRLLEHAVAALKARP